MTTPPPPRRGAASTTAEGAASPQRRGAAPRRRLVVRRRCRTTKRGNRTRVVLRRLGVAALWSSSLLPASAVVVDADDRVEAPHVPRLDEAPVPYFVYEAPPLNMLSPRCTNASAAAFRDYESFKHADDLWFARASLREDHPWRTRDPRKAAVFVVPVLLNLIVEGTRDDFTPAQVRDRWVDFCCDLAVSEREDDPGGTTERVCGLRLVERAARALAQEPAWRAHAARHLIVASHWGAGALFVRKKHRPAAPLAAASLVAFEGTGGQRPVPSGRHVVARLGTPSRGDAVPPVVVTARRLAHHYVSPCVPGQRAGARALSSDGRPPDARPRPLTLHFVGNVDRRDGYRERRAFCGALRGWTDAHFDAAHSTCASVVPFALNRTAFPAPCRGVADSSSSAAPRAASGGKLACTFVGADEARARRDYCAEIRAADLVPYLRGDTFSSAHFNDAVNELAVPIVTHDDQFRILPFADRLPYRNCSLFLPMRVDGAAWEAPLRRHTDLRRDLARLLADVAAESPSLGSQRGLLGDRRDCLRAIQPFVAWNHPQSRVFDLYLSEVVRPPPPASTNTESSESYGLLEHPRPRTTYPRRSSPYAHPGS